MQGGEAMWSVSRREKGEWVSEVQGACVLVGRAIGGVVHESLVRLRVYCTGVCAFGELGPGRGQCG